MLRQKKTTFWGIILAIAVLFTIIPAVNPAGAAENNLTMKELHYSIWPEYDKSPDVLVIYSGTFINDTDAPFDGDLRYKIPKNADINMVCETEKGMLCQRYIIDKDNPDYDVIVWKPSHPIDPGAEFPIMMEYYYKPFAAGSSPKAFTQNFRPAFPVTELTVEIKEPKGSSQVQLQPQAQQTREDGEGFSNSYYSYTNLTEEDALEFEISYVRESNAPSVNPDAPAASAQEGSSGGTNSTVVIALLLVFVLMLAVFLFFAVKNNNSSKNNKNKKSSRQSKQQPSKNKKQQDNKSGTTNNIKNEKRKIRQMLIDNKISEETYKELLDDLEE